MCALALSGASAMASGWSAPAETTTTTTPTVTGASAEQKSAANVPQVSAGNPAARPTLISNKVSDMAATRASQKTTGKTHAGTEMCKQVKEIPSCNGFIYPYTGVDYGYTSNKDTRANGLYSDVNNVTISGGFTTYWDLNVGAMFDFSNSNGTSGSNVDSDANTYSGSIFASRAINTWSLAGVSLTYSNSDIESSMPNAAGVVADQPGVNVDTYTWSPFVSVFKTWGNWTLSYTPTYSMSFSTTDYNTAGVSDEHTTSGTFLSTLKASYAVSEKLSFALGITPTVLVWQETPQFDAPKSDDNWYSVSPSVSYKITDAVNVTAGYKYDAFNNDYENHNATVGLNYSF